MDIEELNLDIISYNKLKRLNINTVEDFNARREDVAKEHPLTYRKVLIKLGEDELCKDHDDREKAMELHQRIMASGTLAAQNLWEMAKALKEMRDGKLYKSLGYQNFESYCENMVGMKRRNAYRYISIVENMKAENVSSMTHFGMTKLSLLAALSEEKQTEIAQTVDLESVTVRQLKEEISKLKGWNKDLGAAKDRAVAAQTSLEEENNRLKDLNQKLESERDDIVTSRESILLELNCKKVELEDKSHKVEALTAGLSKAQERANKASIENSRLEKENKELRERPVEVAVVENSDNERLLKETIRKLEEENYRQNELMDKRYIEDRRKLEADKAAEIEAIRKEYERKLKDAKDSGKSYKEFSVLFIGAKNAIEELVDFCANETTAFSEKSIGMLKHYEKAFTHIINDWED